jgi:NADPH-dependent glutamate synthase beta subunit-like oxidoreductase
MLKRFAADNGDDSWKKLSEKLPPSGKSVAVVGSGPAGLTAAFYLAKLGHKVTVFEALPQPGGMMLVGIPEYRLPRQVLSSEIDEVKSVGVEIRLNSRVKSVDSLFEQGYDAVFLGLGAHQETRLGVEGEDLVGIIGAVEFLRRGNLGGRIEVGERVGVVGGGNVAIDAARMSLRFGAKKVTIFYRRTRNEMPASSEEIDAALEEGVEIIYLVAPSRVTHHGGVLRLECLRMELGEPDASGRARPVPIEGSEFVTSADTIVFAVGQSPDLKPLLAGTDIKTTKHGTIAVDPETLQTSLPGVFAGGDAVTGTRWVIDAIAGGQRAAHYIDCYLKGEVLGKSYPDIPVIASDIKVDIPADLTKEPRQEMHTLAVEQRAHNFGEVELGYDEKQAITEAKRCMNCAGRLCLRVCPYDAPQFGAEQGAKMEKCDFCVERLDEGKNPVCVDACIMRALDWGSMEELKAKYGDIQAAVGFAYSPSAKPSIIFKPKHPPDKTIAWEEK